MNTTAGSRQSSTRSPQRKSIILWGAWLYFGSAALVTFWYAGTFIVELVSGDRAGPDNAIDVSGVEIAGNIFLILFGIVSIWVLWSVSKGYFRKQ